MEWLLFLEYIAAEAEQIIGWCTLYIWPIGTIPRIFYLHFFFFFFSIRKSTVAKTNRYSTFVCCVRSMLMPCSMTEVQGSLEQLGFFLRDTYHGCMFMTRTWPAVIINMGIIKWNVLFIISPVLGILFSCPNSLLIYAIHMDIWTYTTDIFLLQSSRVPSFMKEIKSLVLAWVAVSTCPRTSYLRSTYPFSTFGGHGLKISLCQSTTLTHCARALYRSTYLDRGHMCREQPCPLSAFVHSCAGQPLSAWLTYVFSW